MIYIYVHNIALLYMIIKTLYVHHSHEALPIFSFICYMTVKTIKLELLISNDVG